MNVDKQTMKIALGSLVLALIWSWPAIRQFGGSEATSTEILVSVLIRTIIVFAVIRFILWIMDKNKK